jgi:hypothetical protein
MIAQRIQKNSLRLIYTSVQHPIDIGKTWGPGVSQQFPNFPRRELGKSVREEYMIWIFVFIAWNPHRPINGPCIRWMSTLQGRRFLTSCHRNTLLPEMLIFQKNVEVFLCIPWQSLCYREWTENLPEGSSDHELLSWAAFKHTLSISRIRFHNSTLSKAEHTMKLDVPPV